MFSAGGFGTQFCGLKLVALADTYLSCDLRHRSTLTYLELVEYGYWLRRQTRKSISEVDIRFCLDDIWVTCVWKFVFSPLYVFAGSCCHRSSRSSLSCCCCLLLPTVIKHMTPGFSCECHPLSLHLFCSQVTEPTLSSGNVRNTHQLILNPIFSKS